MWAHGGLRESCYDPESCYDTDYVEEPVLSQIAALAPSAVDLRGEIPAVRRLG
jgi:hypothetical protein